MEPIDFPGRNTLIAKDQKEYLTLPALNIRGKEGETIFCQKMSFIERVYVLITGKIYGSIWTYGKAFPPCRFSPFRNKMFKLNDKKGDKEYRKNKPFTQKSQS